MVNPPPSLNPHETTLAEARIPPEPSNLCLGSFPRSFYTDHKSKTKGNTVRHEPLSLSFYFVTFKHQKIKTKYRYYIFDELSTDVSKMSEKSDFIQYKSMF